MARRFVLCAAAACVALTLACSKSSETPTSPSGSTDPGTSAAADGSTLKATAPTPVSPVDGTQPDALVLTATKASGKFDQSASYSYEFEIKNAAGAVVCNSGPLAAASGSTVSFTPTCPLTLDAAHTWRARALFAGAFGPWSATASFRSPVGGYIRGNELFDPLTAGKTVGQIFGPVTFSSEGVALDTQLSNIRYPLESSLTGGEFSMMIKNIKGASPGDKSKVFSMQQGFDSDITTNNYRFTAEKRGSSYPTPGAVTFRIITGNAGDPGRVFDGARDVVNFDTTRWYFWKFTWTTGTARLEVRLDSETGPIVYASQIGTGSRPYQPSPHVLYLGAPVGRGGELDATSPRIIIKNVWASSQPRPTFPN